MTNQKEVAMSKTWCVIIIFVFILNTINFIINWLDYHDTVLIFQACAFAFFTFVVGLTWGKK